MNRQELSKNKLYTVISNITNLPYLIDNKYFVIYSDETKAISLTNKLNFRALQLYQHEQPMKLCMITECDDFFIKMMSMGFMLFIYNGVGKIHNLSDYYNDTHALIDNKSEIYNMYMSHQYRIHSSHKGNAKLRKIESDEDFFEIPKNKQIIINFVKKQELLKEYYKAIDIPDITPSYISEPSTPTHEIPVEHTVGRSVERPVKHVKLVSVIMFALAAFWGLAFIGSMDDPNDRIFNICFFCQAACYLVLGMFSRKKDLKKYGWAIVAVLFFGTTINAVFSKESIGTIITGLIFTVVFSALFIVPNIKQQSDNNNNNDLNSQN